MNEEKQDYLVEARQIAAQCWCDKETKNTVMDPVLAEAFAKRLAKILEIKVELREALWDLLEWGQEPPSDLYKHGWNRAVEKAEIALKKEIDNDV